MMKIRDVCGALGNDLPILSRKMAWGCEVYQIRYAHFLVSFGGNGAPTKAYGPAISVRLVGKNQWLVVGCRMWML